MSTPSASAAPPGGIVLLGPQRGEHTVASALDALGVDGPLCVITAGWQEREGEVDELAGHVTREITDLMLYKRAEELLAEDPELAEAHRARQSWLKELQHLYRIRLGHTIECAREIMRVHASPRMLERERRAAIAALRALDRYHLRRVRAALEDFERELRPAERPGVAQARNELARIIADSAAVLIAGGHVSVLMNRIRLFDLGALMAQRPIIAWSAGAMVLSERIVLFHDSPPQGAGDAEVVDAGLGAVRRIVPLPHASRRLHLHDPIKVAVFARRFAPDVCVTLDPGALLLGDGEHWSEIRKSNRLTSRGRVSKAVPLIHGRP